jgi:hypothetical protein
LEAETPLQRRSMPLLAYIRDEVRISGFDYFAAESDLSGRADVFA